MEETIRFLLLNLTILILVWVVYKLKRKVSSYEKDIEKLKERVAILNHDVAFIFKCVNITKTPKQNKENSDASKN